MSDSGADKMTKINEQELARSRSSVPDNKWGEETGDGTTASKVAQPDPTRDPDHTVPGSAKTPDATDGAQVNASKEDFPDAQPFDLDAILQPPSGNPNDHTPEPRPLDLSDRMNRLGLKNQINLPGLPILPTLYLEAYILRPVSRDLPHAVEWSYIIDLLPLGEQEIKAHMRKLGFSYSVLESLAQLLPLQVNLINAHAEKRAAEVVSVQYSKGANLITMMGTFHVQSVVFVLRSTRPRVPDAQNPINPGHQAASVFTQENLLKQRADRLEEIKQTLRQRGEEVYYCYYDEQGGSYCVLQTITSTSNWSTKSLEEHRVAAYAAGLPLPLRCAPSLANFSGGGFGEKSAGKSKTLGSLFGGLRNGASSSTAGGLFGGNPSLGGGLFGKPPTTSGSLFGTLPLASSGPSNTAASSSNLFSNPNPYPSFTGGLFSKTPTSSGGLFGTNPPTTSGSVFGSKPAAPPPTSNLFGAPKTSAPAPTGGLFSNQTAAPSSTGNLFGAPKTNAPAPAGGLFPSQTASQTASLFGGPAPSAVAPANKPIKPTPAATAKTSAFTPPKTHLASQTVSLFGGTTPRPGVPAGEPFQPTSEATAESLAKELRDLKAAADGRRRSKLKDGVPASKSRSEMPGRFPDGKDGGGEKE